MLELNIPAFGELVINNLVFDMNGTLAVDGVINEDARARLTELSKNLDLYILTADTYGTFKQMAVGLPVTGRITDNPIAAEEKLALVEELGPDKTIALGNGNNDVLMLKAAAIGIAVMDGEGASSQAMVAADLVVRSTSEALAMLQNPKRLVAGLRG